MARRKLTLKSDSVRLSHATQVELAILFWDVLDAVAGLTDERKRSSIAAIWRLADTIEITDYALQDAKKYRPQKSIYKMSDSERRQFFKDLDAKLAAYTKPPTKLQKDIDQMDGDELRAHNRDLLCQLRDRLEGRTPPPATPKASEPETTTPPEEEPEFCLPTKRMEKALLLFGEMSDDDQVNSLRQMWG